MYSVTCGESTRIRHQLIIDTRNSKIKQPR